MDTTRRSSQTRVRAATLDDAAAIAEIYNQGIEDRIATFETTLRSAEERRAWLESHADGYPVIVAEAEGEVVGWASVSPYSPRACYRGIGEASMFVRRDRRHEGIGTVLMAGLLQSAARASFQKLIARIFSFNAPSLGLCRKHGFREVGVHEKHAKLDGRWCDVVVVERLILENVDD